MPVFLLDLNFLNRRNTIAAYAVSYSGGVVLVDCGPGSTLEALASAMQAQGLDMRAVTHILLTHIHLDHAGAAGWFARQGARVYVHPAGAPHMRDPEKLLGSAKRLYADRMEALWGEFLPVPEMNLIEVRDGAEISVGELRFTGLYTPGHADHHVAYILDDVCFAGDFGGLRLPGPLYLRLPLVPPELHLGKWRESVNRLLGRDVRRVAVSHCGIYEDAAAHWKLSLRLLDEVDAWLTTVMPAEPTVETLGQQYTTWLRKQGLAMGMDDDTLAEYDAADPAFMSASGLQRYWRKVILGL